MAFKSNKFPIMEYDSKLFDFPFAHRLAIALGYNTEIYRAIITELVKYWKQKIINDKLEKELITKLLNLFDSMEHTAAHRLLLELVNSSIPKMYSTNLIMAINIKYGYCCMPCCHKRKVECLEHSNYAFNEFIAIINMTK
jgi:hypothetical protein